ncbi:MAG: SOS response-associated peptidase [Planctomycetota bacterium]
MCGRFTLHSRAEVIAEQFGVPEPARLPERFNIAPAQQVLAVRLNAETRRRELVALHWGLIPFWADDPSIGNRMTNARSETVAEKPSFRRAFKSQRCLLVADGFYEWQETNGKKQPYHVRRKDGRPFGLAGLWERWDKQGGPIESCTILTTDANEIMSAIHERMPVIIPPEKYPLWLDPAPPEGKKLAGLLRPFDSGEMVAYPVSTFVNNAQHDSAQCIEPVERQWTFPT